MKKFKYFALGGYLFIGCIYAENSQWVEWIADVGVSYSHVQNLNFSAFSNDENSDNLWRINGSFGRYYQLSGTTRMQVMVLASTEIYSDFDKMNNQAIGTSIGFRHKFGVGFNVPYVQLNMEYFDRKFDADGWSHKILSGRVELGQHITERLTLSGSVIVSEMDGKKGPQIIPDLSSRPFDQQFWRATIALDYLISQDWLASIDYSRRQGDFHSACTVENVEWVLETMKVKAITTDEIFGGCVYQLDGDTNIYSASLSYAISEHAAVNLDARFFDGHADTLDYEANDIQLSFNYRY